MQIVKQEFRHIMTSEHASDEFCNQICAGLQHAFRDGAEGRVIMHSIGYYQDPEDNSYGLRLVLSVEDLQFLFMVGALVSNAENETTNRYNKEIDNQVDNLIKDKPNT